MKLTDEVDIAHVSRFIIDKSKKICIKYKYEIRIFMFIFVMLYFLPVYRSEIYWGLDDSWRYFQNIAGASGFVFGKDVFFTYGPMGFLIFPLAVNNNLVLSSIFYAILYIYNGYVMFYFIVKKRQKLWIIGVILILLYKTDFMDYRYGIIFTLILMSFMLCEKKHSLYNYIGLCVFSSFLWLVKFDLAALSTLIAVWFLILCIFGKIACRCKSKASIQKTNKNNSIFLFQKDISVIPYCFGILSIPVFFIVFYMIYNPSLSDLKNYLFTGLKISSGYSSTMSVLAPYSFFDLVIICISGLIFVAAAVYKKSNMFCSLLISVVMVGFSYKYECVRNDFEHFALKKTVGLILIILILSIDSSKLKIAQLKNETSVNKILFFLLICVTVIDLYIWLRNLYCLFLGVCVIVFVFRFEARVFVTLKKILLIILLINTLQTFSLIYRGVNNKIDIYKSNGAISSGFALPEDIRSEIGDSTVTCYPWDILWSYNDKLNYIPYPVYQAYCAYTPELDLKNAEFFESEKAPEYIILADQALDNRNMAWEAPDTWNTISKNYQLIMNKKDCYLLKKNESPVNVEFEKRTSFSADINDEIQIPLTDNQIYLRAKYDLTLKGRIVKTLFRIDPVYMEVEYSNGVRKKFRILPEQLEHEICLNQTIFDDEAYQVVSMQICGNGADYYKTHIDFELSEYKSE